LLLNRFHCLRTNRERVTVVTRTMLGRIDRVKLLLIPATVGAALALWGMLGRLDFSLADNGRRLLVPGVYIAFISTIAVFTFERREDELRRRWVLAPMGCVLLLIAAAIVFGIGLQIR
jgi:hypothetical protein